jgi:hypothetical protein
MLGGRHMITRRWRKLAAFAAIPGSSAMWAVGLFRSGRVDLAAILLDGRIPR